MYLCASKDLSVFTRKVCDKKNEKLYFFSDEKFCIFWEIQNFFIKILIMFLNRIEIYSRLGNNLLCVGELQKFSY